MKNNSRDLTGMMGRAASIVFGALIIERGVTAYFGPIWGAVVALSLALAVFAGVYFWSRRNQE